MTRFENQLIESANKLRAVAFLMARDRSAAEDLVQDTMTQMWAARASFVDGTNFMGWAYRIMRNRWISLARRRRYTTIELDDAPGAALGRAPSQEDAIVHQELMSAIGELPKAQQQALMLVGAAGLSYDEAATSLECSVGTVKSRVSRAREALRVKMLGEIEAPVEKAAAVRRHRAKLESRTHDEERGARQPPATSSDGVVGW